MVRRRQGARSLRSVFGVLLVMGCGGNSTSLGHSDGPGDAGSSGAAATGVGGSSGSVGGSVQAGMGGAAVAGAGGSSERGGAGGSADAGTGGSAVAGPNIEGEWAMIGFEDPVAVRLAQQGTVLTGYGCCAGLEPALVTDCCGSISDGSIVNGRARFGFAFDVGAVYEYAADVTVSKDGQRMFGHFSRGSRPTAWVRMNPIDRDMYGYLARNAVVYQPVRDRVGAYPLTLVDATADGSDYSPGAVYELGISGTLPLVWGDLGPFWGGEMSWLSDEETLVVGPVPVTDPSFPIALRLDFQGVVLTSVEAEMASGARYLFNAR
ncbi:MAG TPA: hypothetical protein VFZ53_35215 [Polyangiaceae bacterium]